MATCQHCARVYDPRVTSSPMHYCSNECYDYGSRPYNKASLEEWHREDRIKAFATEMVEYIHYTNHSGDDRQDCGYDECVRAKILGL